jgi:hypothetical protein
MLEVAIGSVFNFFGTGVAKRNINAKFFYGLLQFVLDFLFLLGGHDDFLLDFSWNCRLAIRVASTHKAFGFGNAFVRGLFAFGGGSRSAFARKAVFDAEMWETLLLFAGHLSCSLL